MPVFCCSGGEITQFPPNCTNSSKIAWGIIRVLFSNHGEFNAACVIFIFADATRELLLLLFAQSAMVAQTIKDGGRSGPLVFPLVSRDRGAEGCPRVDSRRACPPLPLATCWPMVRRPVTKHTPAAGGSFSPAVCFCQSPWVRRGVDRAPREWSPGATRSRELWGVRACEPPRNACSDFSSPRLASVIVKFIFIALVLSFSA
jgi:hypothetical protein